jgi:predicted nucleic acid-binding protein
MMSEKIFIDTNILVYSVDRHDMAKREICRNCLRWLHHNGLGVISTQVMQEFYVTATKKLGVEPLIAKSIISSFENFEVLTVTPALIKEAIDCHIVSEISFWDALIVVSAENAHCQSLWTEDLNDGQLIRGVRIVNPLKRRLSEPRFAGF